MKPSPKRATLERQGKRKTEADGQRNKTSGGGGRQKRLNQPDTAQTYNNLSTQRAKPTWREENARTHEKRKKKGTHGELVDDRMHPQLMQFPLVRLNGLSSSHNPLDGLRVQPLNYVHSWTSPTTKKERKTTPKACPVAWSWKKRWSQAQRHVVQHIDIDRWDLEKRPTVPHYLHELLIQKCKFRQKRWGQAQRQAVQRIDIDKVRHEKRPAVHFT